MTTSIFVACALGSFGPIGLGAHLLRRVWRSSIGPVAVAAVPVAVAIGAAVESFRSYGEPSQIYALCGVSASATAWTLIFRHGDIHK